MNDKITSLSEPPAPSPVGGEILQVDRLSKTYMLGRSPIPVLKNVCLSAHFGEAISIIGASGSGKSTLLHVMGGLDKPNGGIVRFHGLDLYSLPADRRTDVRGRHVGFVFQFYHLLPELTVLENVMLPALSRASPAWDKNSTAGGYPDELSGNPRDFAVRLLEAVDLAGRAGHFPAELSGGEQQRCAIARAMINQPDIVLADEPTGNLDSVTGGKVLDFLFALVRDRGHTIVLATHNSAVAERADRVLELKDGVLQEA